LTELFVARQQLIERFELAQRLRLKRFTHVLVDKGLEPIPQGARLPGNGVELTGESALSQALQDVPRHQPSVLEPDQKVFPRGNPLDLGIDRDCEGVQEVQSKILGDEKWGRARGCHRCFEKKLGQREANT
jgi:hypothetical protein